MRPQASLYVDVGYLLASAATRVTGTSLRSGIHVQYGQLAEGLSAHASDHSGLPLLRLHWYDSAREGVPDAQQARIGELPRVKLRLGRFGVDGLQKGVDLRIGLDLLTHARTGAGEVFYLVSGDDDLTEAVEEAQVHGVQVVVLAVPSTQGRPHGVSRHLIRAADEVLVLSPDLIDATVSAVEANTLDGLDGVPATTLVPAPPGVAATVADTHAVAPRIPTPAELSAKRRPLVAPAAVPGLPVPAPTVLAYSASTGGEAYLGSAHLADVEPDVIERVVGNVLSSVLRNSPSQLASIERDRPSIPREIDRALLVDLSNELGVYDLDEQVRVDLRRQFWEGFERRLAAR